MAGRRLRSSSAAVSPPSLEDINERRENLSKEISELEIQSKRLECNLAQKKAELLELQESARKRAVSGLKLIKSDKIDELQVDLHSMIPNLNYLII